jgi:hypothetical protein
VNPEFQENLEKRIKMQKEEKEKQQKKKKKSLQKVESKLKWLKQTSLKGIT